MTDRADVIVLGMGPGGEDVAERLATRIGILSGGKLLAEGDLAALQTHAGLASGSLEDVFLQLTTA